MSEKINLWINKAVTCTVTGRETKLGNLSTGYSLNSEGDLWMLHIPDLWMITIIVGLVEREDICSHFWCLLSVFLQMKIYFLVSLW